MSLRFNLSPISPNAHCAGLEACLEQLWQLAGSVSSDMGVIELVQS
jgi:hypothetical protein